MHQRRTKHELGRVDIAYGVLDVVIPVGVDGYAVEDGHESSDGEPDHGASLEDTDSHSDVRDTEEAPVEAEDGKLGEAKGHCVCELGNE